MPNNLRSGTCSLVRVLAAVALPIDVSEVHELAAADVVIDGEGARIDAVQAKEFDVSDWQNDCTRCTPLHVAAAVWGRRQPAALAAHDAATTALVFPRALTNHLPWLSLHKIARRVWPGQPSYEADALSRWRAWAGPRNPFSSPLPSGAEKDVELAAGLLVELLNDQALGDVAELVCLEELERRPASDTATEVLTRTPLIAALTISDLPSKPLRRPPDPWDDQRDWAGVSVEDLWHFARFSSDVWTTTAAQAELEMRRASAKPEVSRVDPLPSRS